MDKLKDIIFISHATPDDNEFTKWLALQLIGLGYKVWCDVFKLKGGEDFWTEIESTIRDNSVKFLYVLSKNSNNREGTLKELTVAQKVKKHLQPQDPYFIIPLHIDKDLSYDEINIDLVRLNSVNFKKSWHKGLLQLIERLQEDQVPTSEDANPDIVNLLWKTVLLKGRNEVEKLELYSSNWFPLRSLPQTLYFHKLAPFLPHNFPMWECRYPARKYKEYFATFAGHYDFMEELPKTERYDPKNSIKVSVEEIIRGEYDTQFVSSHDAKNILTYLINLSFRHFFKLAGLRSYKMASKNIAFWFPKDALEKDKINGVLMVGKMKYGKDNHINWHFAISGNVRGNDELYYVIKSHIIFTWDGKAIIPKDSVQHSGRRKQGKNWWNKHWREKLLNFILFFSDEEGNISIAVGEQESITFCALPIVFESPVTYNDPSDENLPEEDDDRDAAGDDEYLETEYEGTELDNEESQINPEEDYD